MNRSVCKQNTLAPLLLPLLCFDEPFIIVATILDPQFIGLMSVQIFGAAAVPTGN